MKALTIHQPWAWLIANGYKDIENRCWRTKLRERIWIHAGAKTVTKADYENFLRICRERRIKRYPKRDEFKLGGIVGSAELVDCIDYSRSYWFSGPYGFVLMKTRKTRFRPLSGKLMFFNVEPAKKK